MPRRVDEPRVRQLLLRLTQRQMDVLESVAHLERATPNAYAHEVLVEHLAGMLGNSRVQNDLENRAGYDSDVATSALLSSARKRGSPKEVREAPEAEGSAGL